MNTLHDGRITRLFGIELPILQAPMAGASTPEMVIAVCEAGGLGSLPGAMLSAEQMRAALDQIRAATRRPINLNFFVHAPPVPNPEAQSRWKDSLMRYFLELGLDPPTPAAAAVRAPFDASCCSVVEDYRPEVVSFHFGLPSPELLARVRRAGAKLIASATTVAEARWLEERGADAVVAMGRGRWTPGKLPESRHGIAGRHNCPGPAGGRRDSRSGDRGGWNRRSSRRESRFRTGSVGGADRNRVSQNAGGQNQFAPPECLGMRA